MREAAATGHWKIEEAKVFRQNVVWCASSSLRGQQESDADSADGRLAQRTWQNRCERKIEKSFYF